MNARVLAGVDVGGTFTDVFVLDEAKGRRPSQRSRRPRSIRPTGSFRACRKAPATSDGSVPSYMGRPSERMPCWNARARSPGLSPPKASAMCSRCAAATRPRTWGLWGTFEPVVSRDRRVEVDERVLADGTVRTSLDPEEVKRAARVLLDAGCEAVAIAFINAYANDANERAALEAVRSVWPNAHVSGSHLLVPEIREFERISTATSTPISNRRSAGISRGSKKRSRKTAPTAMS